MNFWGPNSQWKWGSGQGQREAVILDWNNSAVFPVGGSREENIQALVRMCVHWMIAQLYTKFQDQRIMLCRVAIIFLVKLKAHKWTAWRFLIATWLLDIRSVDAVDNGLLPEFVDLHFEAKILEKG